MESCLALTHLEVEGDPGFSGEKKTAQGACLGGAFLGVYRPPFICFIFILSLFIVVLCGESETCSLSNK